MIGLAEWYDAGQRVRLSLADAQPAEVFCRVTGEGAWVTLLHGFPTCSWDWAAIADTLAPERRLLMPDLLGFGDSDKPLNHHYSLMQQADLIAALWTQLGIEESALVGHDIGATVALELLARHAEGRLSTSVSRVVLLNSALYAEVSRPRLAQRLLANSGVGPVFERFVDERLFTRNLSAVFSAAHPLPAETAHAYWTAFQRHATSPRMHALLQYIPERTRHRLRWEAALEQRAIPPRFIWGMADPISGAAVAERIRSRIPNTTMAELETVGHYPQLEVPEHVVAELRTAL